VDVPTVRKHKLSSLSVTAQSYVIVELRLGNGLISIGEAATLGGPRWSEESVESIKAMTDTYLAPALIGSAADRLETARVRMDEAAKRNNAAKGAIDSALFDAVGKTLGVSAVQLLGRVVRESVPPPVFVAVCATPPQGKVLVTAGIDKWDIGPTVDTAQLDRIAKQTGAVAQHQPYGFYSGDVAYAVTANMGNTAKDSCPGPIFIHVTMRLTNRHIGVAADIPRGSCRFARIAAHYRHHAEADQEVFQRYVLKVTTILGEAQMSALIAASETDGRAVHIPSAVNE
jgi:hypothetical protein